MASDSSKPVLGIIGGGQLGRMMTQAATPLGIDVVCAEASENSPASQVGATQLVGELSDVEALTKLVDQADFVTWEIEHFSVDALEEALSASERPALVNPAPSDLRIIQDKLHQKQFLAQNSLPLGDFEPLDALTIEDAEKFLAKRVAEWGGLILKSRKGGFDGRGNFVVRSPEQISQGLAALCPEYDAEALYIEKLVPFSSELSVLVAKGKNGVEVYDIVDSVHKDNICHTVSVPSSLDQVVQDRARTLGQQVVSCFDGMGVFAIEMFVVGSDEQPVLINEIAPRVHNSGHHTIEGAVTSQFENHVRAVCGMEVTSAASSFDRVVMMNILGEKDVESPALPATSKVSEDPDIFQHWYGKAPVKPARKMGHLTVVSDDLEYEALLQALVDIRTKLDL